MMTAAWRSLVREKRADALQRRFASAADAALALARKNEGAPKLAVAGAIGATLGGGLFVLFTALERPAEPPPFFETCRQARQAGLAPAMRGSPGYWPHLDADQDGLSCEPFVDY